MLSNKSSFLREPNYLSNLSIIWVSRIQPATIPPSQINQNARCRARRLLASPHFQPFRYTFSGDLHAIVNWSRVWALCRLLRGPQPHATFTTSATLVNNLSCRSQQAIYAPPNSVIYGLRSLHTRSLNVDPTTPTTRSP